MKILVISDLHGDLKSGEVFEEAYNLHKPDFILCLGDILYHGPRNDLSNSYNPKKLIPIINKYKDKIVAVRGNCDAEVDQMVLDFPINADKNIFYNNGRKIFATHGHLFKYEDVNLNKGDIFISGHTHILLADKINDIFILNPGSMSLPKQKNPKTYGMIYDDKFVIYNLDHSQYKMIEF